MEKYEAYRDSVDGLPSCQRELQLYQKKVQDLADNREKLAGLLKEVGVGRERCVCVSRDEQAPGAGGRVRCPGADLACLSCHRA